MRHPLYLGFFLAFWATPQMTAGHLLLAAGVSIYMLIAIRYEEHDLIGLFGKDYEDYRAEVGMLTPRFRRRRRGLISKAEREAHRRAHVVAAMRRCAPAGGGRTGCRRTSLAAEQAEP